LFAYSYLGELYVCWSKYANSFSGFAWEVAVGTNSNFPSKAGITVQVLPNAFETDLRGYI